MGRRPRIHYPGAVYHAIARGNNRQPIFVRSEDHAKFNDLVEEGVRRFGHRIHAFCWMSNHVHLAVEVDEAPLSAILHNLCSRYANWFNRKYLRSGHVFERRYRAGLIETGLSVRRLVRYIHLNPIRAGVVSEPLDYPWSSHRSYLGEKNVPWLETRWVLHLFGDTKEEASKELEDYVVSGIRDELDLSSSQDPTALLEDCRKLETSRTQHSGDERLLGGSAPWRLATAREVIDVVCTSEEIEFARLPEHGYSRRATNARAIAAFIARECENLTVAELARALNRDPSTMSRGAEGVSRRLTGDEELSRRVQLIREKLRQAVLKRKI